MTGTYATPPDNKMALDVDGSVILTVMGGNATQWTNQNIKDVVDESTSTGAVGVGTGQSNGQVVVVFPQLRDVAGYFLAVGGSWGYGGGFAVETSVDTTNGMDGTWVGRGSIAGVVGRGSAIVPAYRSGIQTVSYPGVKAVRFRGNTGGLDDFIPNTLHLYGKPTGASDRLELWHPTLDQRLGAIDWGDVPRTSGAQTVTFRVKNLSSTLTANTVVLDVVSLTDPSTPTLAAGHTVSTDGTSFAATKTIANIAPGTISAVCTLKWTPAGTNTLGLWAGRLRAVAGSWS